MESPFMRSYALQLIRTCHQRDAPAIGGMSALIPIKNDPIANEKALNGVRLDKRRDARDGFDGDFFLEKNTFINFKKFNYLFENQVDG